MAEKKGSKRTASIKKSDAKSKTTLEQGEAESKKAIENAVGKERFRPEAEEAMDKASERLAAIQAKVEEEQQARVKSETLLAEVNQILANAQAELERESQARIKVEKTLSETQMTLVATQSELDRERQARFKADTTLGAVEAMVPAPPPGEAGRPEQRVSFVIRLMVDESGKPRRTEIEHVQSGNKEAFRSLDISRLEKFIEACIRPKVEVEEIYPQPSKVEIKKTLAAKSTPSLEVSDVLVFRHGSINPSLSFNSADSIFIQARYQIESPESLTLTDKKSSIEIKIYAYEVSDGSSRLLAKQLEKLAKGISEYTTNIQIHGLPEGIYRLMTLVASPELANLVSYYEGPVIQVENVLQPV